MTEMHVQPVRDFISRIIKRGPSTGKKAASTPVTFYPDQIKAPRKKTIQIGAPLHIIRQIREQLEDYLTSINQNTDEIHTNFEAVNQLDQKVNKLNERIEELSMQLQMSANPVSNLVVEPLTTREQEVFLVLYTAEDFISQSEVASRLHLPVTLIRQFLTSLMEKGVSITRKGHGNELLVKLDPGFKERQAKENIAGISEQLTLALATTGTLG